MNQSNSSSQFQFTSTNSLQQQQNSTQGSIQVGETQEKNQSQIQNSDLIFQRFKNIKLDLTVNSLQQESNSEIANMKNQIMKEIQKCRFAKEENIFQLIQIICASLNKFEFLLDYNIRIQFDQNCSLENNYDIQQKELNSVNLRNLINEQKHLNVSLMGISNEFKQFLTTNLSDVLRQYVPDSQNLLKLIINGTFQQEQN